MPFINPRIMERIVNAHEEPPSIKGMIAPNPPERTGTAKQIWVLGSYGGAHKGWSGDVCDVCEEPGMMRFTMTNPKDEEICTYLCKTHAMAMANSIRAAVEDTIASQTVCQGNGHCSPGLDGKYPHFRCGCPLDQEQLAQAATKKVPQEWYDHDSRAAMGDITAAQIASAAPVDGEPPMELRNGSLWQTKHPFCYIGRLQWLGNDFWTLLSIERPNEPSIPFQSPDGQDVLTTQEMLARLTKYGWSPSAAQIAYAAPAQEDALPDAHDLQPAACPPK